jgi:hypothetical protein
MFSLSGGIFTYNLKQVLNFVNLIFHVFLRGCSKEILSQEIIFCPHPNVSLLFISTKVLSTT